MTVKIIDCEQGSDDWYRARMGIPTASAFHLLVKTDGTASAQSQSDKYANHILAEELIGRPIVSYSSPDMHEGKEREQESVNFYELERRIDTLKVGFIHDVPRTMGCSADRLVGKDGMLELKNPTAAEHLKNHFDPRGFIIAHTQQVQGGLLVAERKWCDLMSYYPELPPVIIRIERKEQFIANIRNQVECFNIKLNKRRDILFEQGHLKLKAVA